MELVQKAVGEDKLSTIGASRDCVELLRIAYRTTLALACALGIYGNPR